MDDNNCYYAEKRNNKKEEGMERYYQKEIETADREQILAWQNERLVTPGRHGGDNVP